MANCNALKLDPEAVRRRASSIVGCTEVPLPSASDHVCSFVVGRDGEWGGGIAAMNPFAGKNAAKLALVTVFCDTGTVATGRELSGDIRYTFRKNVTSLDVVESCLRQPAEVAAIDWNLVGPTDFDKEEGHTKSVYKNLELIEVGVAILRGEREELVRHVQALESSAVKKAEVAAAEAAGVEFQFSLAAGPMKHVDQCLNDINKMGKLVRGVATNGVGTVFLYGNGGVAYTPNIPRALYQRLSQLRTSKLHASRPSYVALGTKDRYFAAFHDGSFNYSKGPKGFDKELKNLSEPPRSVAFGHSYDAFLIVHHDGSYKYQGRGIPADLDDKLAAHTEREQLACVNMGPSGEWFLRTQDGRVGWGGISDDMEKAIQELLDDGHFLNMLCFGENGSYFISYD